MSSSRILHSFFFSVLPSVDTDSTTDISASILLLRVLQISRDSSRAASAPPGNLSNKKRNRTTTPPPSLLLRIVYLHDKTVAGFLVATIIERLTDSPHGILQGNLKHGLEVRNILEEGCVANHSSSNTEPRHCS
ncbi:unnamed protein product [Sphagnum jensenii]|uniref:Uncharacterized protein n=1 Tax=Sphagnum jensenii TaxID=128206 RepID=A0ABP1A9F5_9BRYO